MINQLREGISGAGQRGSCLMAKNRIHQLRNIPPKTTLIENSFENYTIEIITLE